MLPATLTTAQHFIRAFSWMLLHSLWIGLLMALVTGVMLGLSGNSSATKRYNLVLVNFLLLIAGCTVAFALEWNKVAAETVKGAVVTATHGTSPVLFGFNFETLKQFADTCLSYFSANAPTVVLLWFVFFVFRSARMIGGMVYIHRAKRRLIFNAGDDWTARVGVLCQRIGVSKVVKLFESGYVKVPMVIGNLRPVILMPVGMLAGIPSGQVEAILLHELAHIRRHDYLVNLLQAIAETVFFFNPGLLWISSLLREERENCCDDIAIGQIKSKKEFVQALISFREHTLYGGRYEVAFPGRKNQLLNRASRIISNKNRTFGTPEKASFTAGLIVLLAILTTAAVTNAESVRRTIVNTVTGVVARNDKQQPGKLAAPETTIRIPRETWRHIRTEKLDSIPASPRDSDTFATDNKGSAASGKAAANAMNADKTQTTDKAFSDDKLPQNHDAEQALHDKAQALRDEEQAKHDKAQAIVDEDQGKKDREQAIRDREQAKKDQAHNKPIAAQKRNEVSALQGKMNQDQEIRNQEQVARNEDQVRLNQQQDLKNSEQGKRNEEQARLNKIQEEKNAEQAKRNEQQARLNEQQEKKNMAAAAKNEKQAGQNNTQAEQNKISVQR